jgi:signal transduction histidine kinase
VRKRGPRLHPLAFGNMGAEQTRSDSVFFRSRVALAVGFGGLLSIMGLAGIDALRVLQQFRRSDDQIRRRYLAENHVLNDIRSDVYVSGTYVRDYLLEPEPQRADAYRVSLEEVRKHMEAALDSYGRQVAPAEAQHYTELRAELADYWGILAPIFQWDAAERRRSGYSFLRDEVFPRRQNMLELAGRIDALNEQQLDAGNQQVVSLLLSFQTRLLLTLLAALALGLGLALFTMRKIFKLEDQARLQYADMAEARTQLKELSARLVQAQEEERRSLSRELHDEVGQALSAVLVELRNLSTGLAVRSEEQSRRHVENIRGLVESAVGVVRNMALLLRPSMLDDLGLIPALKWQARESSKSTSMDVSVDVSGAARLDSAELPDDYKTCIYRVVQEALHNCARHSRASTVRIRVTQERDRLLLNIHDDGQGFDVRHTKGLGLLGIQERVSRLGGTCQVHSQPGHGTTLSVELPFAVELPLNDENRSARIGETDSHPVG